MIARVQLWRNAENAESGLGYAAVEGSVHPKIRLCCGYWRFFSRVDGRRKERATEKKKKKKKKAFLPFVTLDHLELDGTERRWEVKD
jgi:hypothetical protein